MHKNFVVKLQLYKNMQQKDLGNSVIQNQLNELGFFFFYLGSWVDCYLVIFKMTYGIFFLKQKFINNKERKQQQQNLEAEQQLEADTLEVNTKSEVGKFAKQPNLGLFLCDNLE